MAHMRLAYFNDRNYRFWFTALAVGIVIICGAWLAGVTGAPAGVPADVYGNDPWSLLSAWGELSNATSEAAITAGADQLFERAAACSEVGIEACARIVEAEPNLRQALGGSAGEVFAAKRQIGALVNTYIVEHGATLR